MKLDYLYGTSFELEQHPDMYHFNSDTEFLGKMLEIQAGDSVLDVGCNTGALMLFASQYTQHICGIDLFEELLEITKRNLEHNHVQAELFCTRLQDFQHDLFDVIVCNPPYFPTKKESLKNTNQYLRAARHEDYLSASELFLHSARLLKEDGILEIVHRAERMEELCIIAKRNGLYLNRYRLSYDHRDGKAKSCILFFTKQETNVIEYKPAFMDDRDSFSRKEIEQ